MTLLDRIACRYIAKETEGLNPDQVVAFFVKNLIFKNSGWLERITEEQGWKDDILRIRERMAVVGDS